VSDVTTTAPIPAADDALWDLTPLATDADAARTEIAAALERCASFAERYRGRIEALTGPELAELLAELGGLDSDLSRLGSYAHLREALDITDAENLDLSSLVDRSYVEAGNHLRFFELEWMAAAEETAMALADAPEVAADRHYLIAMRRFAPYTLSEPEERMLAERAPAAVSAWHTLFGRINSTLEAPFDSGEGTKPHNIDQLLACMRHPDRPTRIGALDTLYAALDPHAPVLAHCYDTLVSDRLAMDRLRGYGDPMEQTNLGNEVSTASVNNMLDAVARNYDLAQRWFRAKAELLGLDRLVLADQYAPLGDERPVDFPQAITYVTDAFTAFSPRIADIAERFVSDRRVDAPARPGKRGGAFCSPVAHDVKPYVLLNFTSLMNDVLTVAHEFGHGMHFELSHLNQTHLSASPGIVLCEVASTFAEQITYDHLVRTEDDDAARRLLACERVEGAFATIFRQAVLARYEKAAYTLRDAGTTLTAERLGEIWLAENSQYYGDSVAMPEGYRLGWAYIPHFIHTRFYTYGYAFALLVSLALVKRHRDAGEAFVEPYITGFLSAGSSASPTEILKRVDLDLDDPGVWDDGFGELERMIDEAQTA
jgi:oligoendopeptidase F